MKKRLELKNKVLLLDGAMGTELHKAGLPDGTCPETWIIDHPEKVVGIHQSYISAGAEAILVPSFGANSLKLKEFAINGKTAEINRELVAITKKTVGKKKILIGGDIGPSGQMIRPGGNLEFEDAVNAFKEQVKALAEANVDFFMIETMLDIQEARAALIAVKETCPSIPAIVSMTFSDQNRTLSGTPPCAAVVTLQSLGAEAVGANCSMGPDMLIPIVMEMRRYAKVPISVKPNAGLPKLVKGHTVFDMQAEEFAKFALDLLNKGASIIGGCCGTTPLHIKKLSEKIRNIKISHPKMEFSSAISSSRKTISFSSGVPIKVIGERINPTGKKNLRDELLKPIFKELRKLAVQQEMKGADLLDINVGAPGCDEKTVLPTAVTEATCVSGLPLCIDSSDPEAIEKALRVYPGRALINSISFEKAKIARLLPAAAKYGAMFILLPLGDGKLPEKSKDRISYIKQITSSAQKLGFSKNDILVDGLVMTVSSNPKAPEETLKTIRWARENGYMTVIGLSNISFGLPGREKINASFLSMAAAGGLTATIANPENDEIMSAKFASDALCNKDEACANYIERFQNSNPITQKNKNIPAIDTTETIRHAVLKGDRNHILEYIENALSKGVPPSELIDKIIIPSIREVGNLYDKKIYFLPQLIMSAETVKKAFEKLEPLLAKNATDIRSDKKTIILATVKGDIHDIGKNIVALMLKNHGYEVIDMGKDVQPKKIVSEAKRLKPHAIGLSALMTTTMPAIQETISKCRNAGLDKVQFLVGGAVVDANFAESVGASYAKDAVEAVRVADKILKKKIY